MYYSLADFLHSYNNLDIRQITNCGQLNKIKIQSVSVQEFPVDDFIRENELVLSTAIGCDEKPERFEKMVDAAVKVHAAAICFSFSSSRFRIPHQAITLAERNQLPIFELPWEVRFSEIQAMIYKELENREQAFWLELQNQLCNLFFESASLDLACETIHSVLNCFAGIVDQKGTVIGHSDLPEETGLYQIEDAPFQADIKIRDMTYGKLCLWGNYDEERVYAESDAVRKSLLFPLSLWFNQKSFEDSLKENLKNEYVCNLAFGRYTSYEDMIRQGLYLKFDMTIPYSCIVLQMQKSEAGESSDEYSIQSIWLRSEIENLLLRMGKKIGIKMMVGVSQKKCILFLERRKIHDEDSVDLYLKKTDTELCNTYPEKIFYWGISEKETNQLTFHDLYQQAALGIRYLLTSEKKTRFFTYHETRKALIVSCLSENEKIREAAKETMAGLISENNDMAMDLMETLSAFFRANYNVSQTARDLHIHRQSLLYRLQKIENITGMKLDQHDDLFVLESFLRIYKDY